MYQFRTPPGTPFNHPVKFQFLEPVTLRIKRPDGRHETIRYGIGETIELMFPGSYYPVCCYDPWYDIPLSDGSTVDDIPDGVQMVAVRDDVQKL